MVIQQPVRESNPPFRREGPMSYADRRTGHLQCAGQELNLQSLLAADLQSVGLADAQPTHIDRMAQAGVEPAVTKV